MAFGFLKRNRNKNSVKKNKSDTPSANLPDEIREDKIKKVPFARLTYGSINDSMAEQYGYPKEIEMPIDEETDEFGNITSLTLRFDKYADYKGFKVSDKRREKLYNLGENLKFLPALDRKAIAVFKEVDRFNRLSAGQQLKEEKRRYDRKRIIKLLAFAIVAFFSITLVYPRYVFRQGKNLFYAGQYKEAMPKLKALNNTESQSLQANAVLLMMAENKEFDKALDLIDELPELLINKEEARNNVNTIKGDYLYSEGHYDAAMKAYVLALDVDKNLEKFKKSAYKSVDELMNPENQDPIKALSNMEYILDYEDTRARFINLQEALYIDAMNKYKNGNYEESSRVFSKLALYNYKSSMTMLHQSQYKTGIDFYKTGNYDKAIKILEEIGDFKDARAIIRDMYYKKGISLLTSNPPEAYRYFMRSLNYKNVNDILLSPQFILYGDWTAYERDEGKIDAFTLSFSLDNTFSSDIPEISGINLGNSEENKYVLDNGYFVNKDSRIEVHILNLYNIKMDVYYDQYVSTYSLTRKTPLVGLLTDAKEIFTDNINNYLKIKYDKATGGN